MVTLTEGPHPGCFIVSESEGPYHTREAVTIAISQTVIPGTVLSRAVIAADATVSAAADAGNTAGAGTITMDGTTPILAGAQNGRYRAVCIQPATNAGTFEVFDPKGISIGKVNVGATFATQIKFVIADATDFVAGDAFSIDVVIEDGDYQYKALDLAGAGDESKAAGIAVYGVTTDGSNTAKITAIVRGPCEVRLSDLVWPNGITADQTAAALRQLEALGIVGR